MGRVCNTGGREVNRFWSSKRTSKVGLWEREFGRESIRLHLKSIHLILGR